MTSRVRRSRARAARWVADQRLALAVLGAGLVSFSGSRRRATALAADMTSSLRRREEELRAANLHLARSNAALAHADQVKDDFLRTMSHELRTPLTAISGFARLLESRWERLGPEERKESVSRIVRSADTLAGLVDDLLACNRTGDDAPALAPVDLDLGVVVGEVVDQLAPLTTGYALRLETGSSAVLADRAAVARILTNLVTNAVKFSPEGTTVTIATRTVDGVAVIEVADEGPGVPADQQDRVFERFVRGALPAHARRPGAGIGLAVVKDLAERMGGSVGVGDVPGGGAVFRVALPLAAAPPVPDGAPAQRAPWPNPGRRATAGRSVPGIPWEDERHPTGPEREGASLVATWT